MLWAAAHRAPGAGTCLGPVWEVPGRGGCLREGVPWPWGCASGAGSQGGWRLLQEAASAIPPESVVPRAPVWRKDLASPHTSPLPAACSKPPPRRPWASAQSWHTQRNPLASLQRGRSCSDSQLGPEPWAVSAELGLGPRSVGSALDWAAPGLYLQARAGLPSAAHRATCPDWTL